jgi:glycosyltransferase involved in cell wall biosynthesis
VKARGDERDGDHDPEDEVGRRRLDPHDGEQDNAEGDRRVVPPERQSERSEQSDPEGEDERERQRRAAEGDAGGEEENEDDAPRRDPREGVGELDSAANADGVGDLQGSASASRPRRPRILLLITLAEVGGAQTYVASLLPALVERFDVVVAAHGAGPLRDATAAAGARFEPLAHVRRQVGIRDFAGLVELVRLLRRHRPDIVHASSSKAGVLGRLAGALAGVPIRAFTVHGWAFAAYPGLTGRLYRLADRLVRPLTTVTVCVSERERKLGIAAGTCGPDRTVVIPNAVDVAGARRVEPGRRDRPLIVAVGRLKAPKDFLTLVRALGRLEPGSFEAVIVGDGPDRVRLEDEIRALGLAGCLTLAGERRDVPELLAAADVFALASSSEGMPVSVLEAMAAGLPVVASRVGGVPEQVVDGETGVLVDPGDAEDLADALSRLLGDVELRRRLGAAGRARAEQAFDLEPFRRAHLELYSRELARRRLPVPAPIP